jgi:acyl-coenzyme A thioesterase THEM4
MSNKDYKVAEDDPSLQYFRTVPAFAKLISSPIYTPQQTRSRTIKTSGEDELFAITLNTPLTIPYCLTISRQENPSDPNSPISDVRTFLRLEHGLNGYPGVCHGGIIATIFDEILGIAVGVAYQHDKAIQKRKGTYQRGSRNPSMTAELVTTYVKPVKVPGNVCVIVHPPKHEGRKVWVESDLVAENGDVLSRGRALFIQLKRSSI